MLPKRMQPLRIAALATALTMVLAGCRTLDNLALRLAPRDTEIVCLGDASSHEQLAAREVRRYVYVRTGQWLPIRHGGETPEGRSVIAIGTAGQDTVRGLSVREPLAQGYVLKSFSPRAGDASLAIIGGEQGGILYGAYRFVESLGVRFYPHGDTIPDGQVDLILGGFDESSEPLFELRGIQPFHDFPEGPDWWDTDDYKAVIAQLPKMRMNFIGLHTYPAPEPTVWLGLKQDVREDGSTSFNYPASYQNTLRGDWGYPAKRTSRFSFGASRLFDLQGYGSEVMRGVTPRPDTPEECALVFDRTGCLLDEAFTFARGLAVKTCVGTETPLHMPEALEEHVEAQGFDPGSKEAARAVYEGAFTRIMRRHPLDYYWLWTPEGWTWGGNTDDQLNTTLEDLNLALDALDAVKAPFQLATCGWVLGPAQDRALLDRKLPPDVPLSSINRQVGKSPVDPAYAEITRHDAWAIPWLEDDPNLLMPQLWVGRMRRDAYDALRYGCEGLMGIHWRTRILGPNAAALARAAWEQGDWAKEPEAESGQAIPKGGNVAGNPGDVAGTEQDEVYRTVRYNMDGYRIPLPSGTYSVTLQFCETHYEESGKRVFGAQLEDRQVVEGLDVFKRVGRMHALDLVFDDVPVEDGALNIDFMREVEYPLIAAMTIQGNGRTWRFNCGGPAWSDYAAEAQQPGRFLPSDDFYLDWARTQFGPEAADEIAAIFTEVDGRLPETSSWLAGPGGLSPDGRAWEDVAGQYDFAERLVALRPRIQGPANLDRFDYWSRQFLCMKEAARLECAWARGDKEEMLDALRAAYDHLLATISTTGGLGTIANWEQHSIAQMDISPPSAFVGEPRLIVPTVRTVLEPAEDLRLRVLYLDRSTMESGALCWRPLGSRGRWDEIPLRHVARGVYEVALPADDIGGRDIEYHVIARRAVSPPLYFPATAPGRGQTVVVMAGAD